MSNIGFYASYGTAFAQYPIQMENGIPTAALIDYQHNGKD
jgi:hypothetical protein